MIYGQGKVNGELRGPAIADNMLLCGCWRKNAVCAVCAVCELILLLFFVVVAVVNVREQ